MEQSSAQEMEARLQQWRQAHPQATFDEMEDAIQQELVHWQAQMMGAFLREGAAGDAGEAAPVCMTCSKRMQRCGMRTRTVVSRLGQPIPFARAYWVCPACGAGLFPPG